MRNARFMLVAVIAGSAGCPEDAQEDLRAAGQSLEQAGGELGQAAQKGAVVVDARTQEAYEEARAAVLRAINVAGGTAPELSEDETPRPTGPAIECAGERYAVDRAYVDQAFESPVSLLGEVTVSPVAQGGITKGYRVDTVDPDGAIGRLGIRPGDILVAVDGRRLDSSLDARWFAALRQASEVAVTIERNGRRIEKTLVIGGEPRTVRG